MTDIEQDARGHGETISYVKAPERAPVQQGADAAERSKPVHLTAEGARALNWAMNTLRDEGREQNVEAVARFFANIFADISRHVSTAMITDLYRRSLNDGPSEPYKRRA